MTPAESTTYQQTTFIRLHQQGGQHLHARPIGVWRASRRTRALATCISRGCHFSTRMPCPASVVLLLLWGESTMVDFLVYGWCGSLKTKNGFLLDRCFQQWFKTESRSNAALHTGHKLHNIEDEDFNYEKRVAANTLIQIFPSKQDFVMFYCS